jgi:hypothetical protein
MRADPHAEIERAMIFNIARDARCDGEFDRLAVRGVPVRIGPCFLARVQLRTIRQPFGGDQAFESREPIVVVMRAIIGLATIGRGFEFIGKRAGPFLPRESYCGSLRSITCAL